MPLAVAKRMGMSDEQMENLNYKMDLEKPLQQGQELCVVPNSCRGSTKTKYSGLDLGSLSAFLGSTTAVHPIKAKRFIAEP